ncbi:hypothetical protein DEJ13_02440 [Curtobacterium sp. MCLR17_007]|uniref:hypothetical protein n=1 Tax=Curtobacterium sp. MCLR17_007 TaxID=2175648 RepID=UPI000DA7827E|nr:hypothetical protein [Curtobacterium sp. MCLR17_007]WIB60706.1 hypothetical protein DEJ13_02440 [Curtobacterium sp. MCLR17_007]
MHTTSRHHLLRGRRALLVAAAIAVTLPFSVAACSTQPSADPGTSAGSGVGAKWGSCMRDAGFDVEDPDDTAVEAGLSKAPAGADRAAFSAAASACTEKAGVERASSADQQKWERQYAQVANCIRENGYDDFPEQEPGSLNTSVYQRSSEPQFETVVDDCLAEFAPDTRSQSVG